MTSDKKWLAQFKIKTARESKMRRIKSDQRWAQFMKNWRKQQ